MSESGTSKVRVIVSEKSWVEGEALRQLEATAQLPGMFLAVGLPDIHPGHGNPIGAAFAGQGVFYPHLLGNDVGCGIGLWQTGLTRKKLKLDKWVNRLKDLDRPWDGDATEFLKITGPEPQGDEDALGTIGGGNHFAELQVVDRIVDLQSFQDAGLDKANLMLLVHSGSRGLGEGLFRSHAQKYGAKGLDPDSEDGVAYLERHEYCLKWARTNRAFVAFRFLEALNAEGRCALDIVHNSLTPVTIAGTNGWLHRKGAAASDRGPVVVAGSRGALSYLVQPIGSQEENAFSIAHGAGRKWNRSSTLERLKGRFHPDSLLRTELGSRVICDDKTMLFEEAPQAYKDIQQVIQDLVDAGLVKVVAMLKPLITYKVRRDR